MSVRPSRLSATLAAWRIARRDAMRHKGRSILVMVMIGLPVAAVVFADVVWRTEQLSPSQRADRVLGVEADAFVQPSFAFDIVQAVDPERDGWQAAESSREGVPGTAALPSGWTLVSQETVGFARFLSADEQRVAPAELLEFRYADPLVAGLIRQLDGRAPSDQDEVVLTTSIADRLDLGVGDTLVPPDRSLAFDIVGVVELPANLNSEIVIADPGALSGLVTGPPAGDVGQTSRPAMFVDAGGPVTWDQVHELNDLGYLVTSRAALLDPPPCGGPEGPLCPESLGGEAGARAFALIALLVVMALLQVVLLAGPAFAIGRRAQTRDLALVAASGGDRRHVGGIVRGGGIVLGGVGGVAGAVIAIVAVIVFKDQLARLNGSALPAIDIQPLDVLVVLGVGVVTGLVAAWLPARQAARQDVVASLAGRRPVPRVPKRIPALGAVAVIVGALIAFYGAGPGDPLAIVFGAVVAELGLVAMSPTLVTWVARIGPRLPAVPRLALRDAARSRTRSGPAVAAVMAAVAGAVAVSIFATSQEAADRRGYVATLPQGMVGVSTLFNAPDAEDLEQIVAIVERELPVEQSSLIRGMVPDAGAGTCDADGCELLTVVTPPQNECPIERSGPVDKDEAAAAASDWRCTVGDPFSAFFGEWLVGDADTLAALTGVDDPDARQALESGGAVMFDRAHVLDGMATLQVIRYADQGTPEKGPTEPVEGEKLDVQRSAEVPAVWLSEGVRPGFGFLSTEAARSIDLPVADNGVLFATNRIPTRDEEDTAQRALDLAATSGFPPALVVERGYQDDTTLALLVLLAVAGVVALGATAIAVGLAAADGRPDLATLAAIGAAPRTRRLLASSQALVIAGLGTLLGILAGFVPGIAAVRSQTDWSVPFTGVGSPPVLPVVIPWGNLALLLIVVPLLAVVCAALFSRSRLPMVRRLT